MKKTALFLFAALFVFALQSQAQVRGGIRAGLNMSTWGGNAVESFSEILNTTGVMRTEMLPSFHAGGYLQLPLGSAVSLEPGLYYSGKGMQVNQTFATESIFKPQVNVVNRMHYVEMPVLLRLHLGPGFQLYGGPQLSYLVDNQVEAEAGVFGLSYEQNWSADPGFRKLDFGLTGGLGYELPGGFNLQAGYEWGLSSLDEGRSNIDAFNRVIKVSMGYTFGK
ncbi:porin family protein [Cesiribacter andamanensis]|uniref:Outer membrane protein beta-barrel domain-containing protein n=1 Tax=Cesiribacter andamanensis AMV16 TaxID=1279009 RepID=M7N7P8_9BACT|nr:porin family protein [Cesiribacter andamanensis]EMR04638.1 hypothetical protein ADICEAN_00241 [Cesiribacter andamanensis AMV16]